MEQPLWTIPGRGRLVIRTWYEHVMPRTDPASQTGFLDTSFDTSFANSFATGSLGAFATAEVTIRVATKIPNIGPITVRNREIENVSKLIIGSLPYDGVR